MMGGANRLMLNRLNEMFSGYKKNTFERKITMQHHLQCS